MCETSAKSPYRDDKCQQEVHRHGCRVSTAHGEYLQGFGKPDSYGVGTFQLEMHQHAWINDYSNAFVGDRCIVRQQPERQA